jgi:hypothetical protein
MRDANQFFKNWQNKIQHFKPCYASRPLCKAGQNLENKYSFLRKTHILGIVHNYTRYRNTFPCNLID